MAITDCCQQPELPWAERLIKVRLLADPFAWAIVYLSDYAEHWLQGRTDHNQMDQSLANQTWRSKIQTQTLPKHGSEIFACQEMMPNLRWEGSGGER